MRPTRRLFNLVQGDARFELKLSNAASTMSALYLYDEISPFGVLAADFVAELAGLGGQDFELHVNSPGGDVFEGLAMLNSLRAYPGKITAVVDGIAASAASFLLCGADEVVMAQNSELMIHDAWGMCMGNAGDMQDMAKRLDSVSDNIASVYSSRTPHFDTTHWRAQMRAETWYMGQQAVDVGLADRIMAKGEKNALTYDLARFGNHKTPEPVAPATEEDPLAGVDLAAILREAFEEAA